MKYALVFAVLALLAGCTRPEKTSQVLADEGYTNITITGYRFFGCGKDDTFHTGFTATGPSGRRVEGVVCSNFFKGSTVRID